MIIFLNSGIDLNIFSPTEPIGIIILFIGLIFSGMIFYIIYAVSTNKESLDDKKIRTEILYAINIFLFGLSFLLSLYIFSKILNLDNDLPLFFYNFIKLENLFIDWKLRFDLFVSGLAVLITFIGLIITLYSINLSNL